MKVNIAALSLLATTATAVPLSAVDTLTPVTGTTTASGQTPSLHPAFSPPDEVESCVMPDGCRDNEKHDTVRAPVLTNRPSKIRTFTVPAETSSHTTTIELFPRPKPTSA